MALEDEYSTKDSNRNRMIEERETNTYAAIGWSALALLMIAGVFYYVDLLRSEHRVSVTVSQEAVSSTPPPPAMQDPDKAKPYDDTKPPYAQ